MQQLINFDCLEELDDFGAVRWQRMPGKEIRHSSEHLCSSQFAGTLERGHRQKDYAVTLLPQ
jgi:hypothetical protein